MRARGLCDRHLYAFKKGKKLEVPALDYERPPTKGKTCKVEGCERKVAARDYCGRHFQMFNKHGYVKAPTEGLQRTPYIRPKQKCTFPACDRPLCDRGHGVCKPHWTQLKAGKPLTPIKDTSSKQTLPRVVQESIRRKCLVIIDLIAGRSIFLNGGGYPCIDTWENGRSRRVRLHRAVMERVLGRPLLPSEVVHHKDHDPINPSPENLELHTSHSEHMQAHHTKRAHLKEAGQQPLAL